MWGTSWKPPYFQRDGDWVSIVAVYPGCPLCRFYYPGRECPLTVSTSGKTYFLALIHTVMHVPVIFDSGHSQLDKDFSLRSKWHGEGLSKVKAPAFEDTELNKPLTERIFLATRQSTERRSGVYKLVNEHLSRCFNEVLESLGNRPAKLGCLFLV